MTSSANNTLNLVRTCVHCGQSIRPVELDGWVGWTHIATGYYTCHLNTFVASGQPWSEYVAPDEGTLAESSTVEDKAQAYAEGQATV